MLSKWDRLRKGFTVRSKCDMLRKGVIVRSKWDRMSKEFSALYSTCSVTNWWEQNLSLLL